MYENFTYMNIMQRLLSYIPNDMDKREGSVIWDALSPAAAELELAYICMEYTFNQGFADTADEPFLLRRAAERGIVPNPATYAVLKAEFTPVTADVAGKRFNLGEVNYYVGDPIENEAGAYQLICETPGTIGHKILGSLIPVEYVEDLQTAAATAILIPGEDEEDVETLRSRYFESFGEKPYGGNVKDYKDKCESIDGVGGCRVTPAWNGGMTVLCTILDSTYSKASQTLIDAVQEIIDPDQDGQGYGVAPIGHIVTINTANETIINISVKVEFDSGFTWNNMGTLIHDTIENYLLELRTEWKKSRAGQNTTVRISQIETRILSLDGVLDVTNTTINGTAGNYTVTNNDIPVLGVISRAQNS